MWWQPVAHVLSCLRLLAAHIWPGQTSFVACLHLSISTCDSRPQFGAAAMQQPYKKKHDWQTKCETNNSHSKLPATLPASLLTKETMDEPGAAEAMTSDKSFPNQETLQHESSKAFAPVPPETWSTTFDLKVPCIQPDNDRRSKQQPEQPSTQQSISTTHRCNGPLTSEVARCHEMALYVWTSFYSQTAKELPKHTGLNLKLAYTGIKLSRMEMWARSDDS